MRFQRPSACAALAIAAAIALAAAPAAARGVSPGSLSSFFVGVSSSSPVRLSPPESKEAVETRVADRGDACV